MNAVEIKACCAAAYASEAARWLLGETFHPGGRALTSQLARTLRVGPGDTLVDVASGLGTSALQVGRESGCRVIGVELSPDLVARARLSAIEDGIGSRVRFLEGDAEALPLPDAAADAVLCECAFCTFPDKAAAAFEMARVLRRGGRLALSDVVAVPERLPPELSSVAAWVACLADARPLDEVSALLEEAGFAVDACERRDDALAALLDRIEARLRLARMLDEALAEAGLALAEAARAAVADGVLGYGVVTASR
jgi:arsenite methyltransferase